MQNDNQQFSQDNQQSDTQDNDSELEQSQDEIKTGTTLKECCSDDEIETIQAK